MTERMLTLADVYKPLSASEILYMKNLALANQQQQMMITQAHDTMADQIELQKILKKYTPDYAPTLTTKTNQVPDEAGNMQTLSSLMNTSLAGKPNAMVDAVRIGNMNRKVQGGEITPEQGLQQIGMTPKTTTTREQVMKPPSRNPLTDAYNFYISKGDFANAQQVRKQQMDEVSEVVDLVYKIQSADPSGNMLKSQFPRLKEMFPQYLSTIDPGKISVKDGKVEIDTPMGKGAWLRSPDGKSWSLVKPERPSSDQMKGVTEKGGYPIVFDPRDKDNPLSVVTAQGEKPYDPKTHGKMLSPTVSQTTIYNQQMKAAEEKDNPPFSKWSAQEKQTAFELMERGIKPNFGWGDKKNRSQFEREFLKFEVSKGKTGAQVATILSAFKTESQALSAQEKQYGPMIGFVENLNMQIDRVKEIRGELSRFDTRLLNIPWRKLQKEAIGKPYENIVEMYTTDLANDIAKLSTGSQASIRELSESAQKHWFKIHDLNLSIDDLIKVLDETKRAGDMRIKSTEYGIKKTKERMSGADKPTLNEFLDKAMPANPKATRQELTDYYNKKYGGQ